MKVEEDGVFPSISHRKHTFYHGAPQRRKIRSDIWPTRPSGLEGPYPGKETAPALKCTLM